MSIRTLAIAPLCSMSKLACVLAALALASGCSANDDALGHGKPDASAGGAGGAAGMGGAGGAKLGPVDAPGISISDKTIVETEPHVVVRPNGDIAVAWIGQNNGSPPRIGYTFSKDHGHSWQAVQETQVAADLANSDPVLAVDKAGNTYLAWLAFQQTGAMPSAMRIYVAKAGPADTTFSPPVEASEPTTGYYDKPWMAVADDGTVVVSYSSDNAASEQAVVATSKDGASWAHATLPGTSPKALIYLCSSPTGRVWAAYLDGTTGLQVSLSWSDDQGATWSDGVAVAGTDEAPAMDGPTCVADADGVWVSYGVGSGPLPDQSSFQQEPKIRVARSKLGSEATFERADAHDSSAGSLFLHPALVLDAGGLGLVYYAGNAPADPAATLRYAGSKDGKTFAPSAIAHEHILFDLSRMKLTFLGDYLGAATGGGRLGMAYVDNTSVRSHVSFAGRAFP